MRKFRRNLAGDAVIAISGDRNTAPGLASGNKPRPSLPDLPALPPQPAGSASDDLDSTFVPSRSVQQGARSSPSERSAVSRVQNSPPPIPMLVAPRLIDNTRKARVAVLLRSHVLDEKFQHLWNSLKDRSSHFDVFPVLDRSAISLDPTWCETEFPGTVWCHPDRFLELGLSHKSGTYNVSWIAGDLAMCVSLVEKPQYDFYVMIDYDVHFTRDGAAYLERLCSVLLSPDGDDIDGVGLEFWSRPVMPGVTADWPNWEVWEFFPAAADVFPVVYHFYFPFVALSRRALMYVFASRQLEAARDTPSDRVVNCEAFVASSLMAAGLRCVDLNTLLPGSYESDSMGLQHLRSDRLAGLPLTYAIKNPLERVEMIHAVYSEATFLEKTYNQRSGSRAELKWALAQIEQNFAAHLPEDLLSNYISRVNGRINQL